jgi:hypothetical protein
MKSFIKAFREFMAAGLIKDTAPILFFMDGKWYVSMYWSESTIKRFGGEVIL